MGEDDQYYLLEDIKITETINISDPETVTLDLNGHVIEKTSGLSVIEVCDGSNFILLDSDSNTGHNGEYASLPTGGVITSDGNPSFGGGVLVDSFGSFTMNGGTIYDCYAQNGGGVFVCMYGNFTMNGGAISGCTAHVEGGGVLVEASGSFIMTGGDIYNCSSMFGSGVSNAGTLYANGGTIKDEVYLNGTINNTAEGGCTVFYGGINIVNNGTISGKKVTFKKDNSTYATEIVMDGGKAIEPTIKPVAPEGYKFTGWYKEETLKTPYDFRSSVNDDELILYAGFDPIITVTAPFTTTVELGNLGEPGKTTFELALIDSEGYELFSDESFDDVEVIATVETDGEGAYTSEMTITGPSKQLWDMMYEGAFVWQYDDEEEGWIYDDTVWGVRIYKPENTQQSASEEPYSLLIYPSYIMDNGLFALDMNAGTVDQMTFTNTYTKSVAAPADSNSNNGAAANIRTGDDSSLALWLALLAVSAAGLIGTGVYSRRRKGSQAE